MNALGEARDRAPSELTPPELAWIIERLPSPLFVVREDLVVRGANRAAQRLGHELGVRVRRGDPLFELGSGPSLRELAQHLFRHRLLGRRKLSLAGRNLVVSGFVQRDSSFGVLVVEDTTAQDRRIRAEEDFLVNASHEFLSPLTSIAAAAHVLERGGDEPEVRERFVRNIVEATNRLVATSRALLVLARAEAGVEPPRLEVVRLDPLLRESLETEPPAGCEVTVACQAGLRTLVDPELLVLALAALCDNACRHARGTPVRVEVAELEQGTRLAIEVVSDDVAARSRDELDRMAARFVSGEGRDSRGFGIGLSIAERATRLMGGRLVLWSGDGQLRVGLHLAAVAVAA